MTTVERSDLIAAAGFTVHEFPNGERVYFRDPGHSYWRDVNLAGPKVTGTGRLTGISGVVAPLDWRADNLVAWAARTDHAGIVALAAEALGCDDPAELRAGLEFLRDPESCAAALEVAGLRWQDTRDQAAARGTRAHVLALEALAAGRPVPDFDGIPERERGYARAVAAWWLDTDPQPVVSEQVVADLALGVAGRLDLVYIDRADQTVLCDLKSGNWITAKAAAQATLYAHCYARCGFGEIDRCEVLQARPDGTYLVIPVECEIADALNAIAVYRAAGRINGAIRRASR